MTNEPCCSEPSPFGCDCPLSSCTTLLCWNCGRPYKGPPLVIQYGPDAPSIAEQLELGEDAEGSEMVWELQLLLDSIAAAEGRLRLENVAHLRQEITESLIKRFKPDWVTRGAEHIGPTGDTIRPAKR